MAHDPEVAEVTQSLHQVVRQASKLAADLDALTELLQARRSPAAPIDGEERRRVQRP